MSMQLFASILVYLTCACHGHRVQTTSGGFHNSSSKEVEVVQARSDRGASVPSVSEQIARLLLAFNSPAVGLSSGIRKVRKSFGLRRSDAYMQEKHYILVTGSSQGIGYSICEALMKKSTPEQPIGVIASGRTATGSASARARILESLPAAQDAEVHALELNVADVDSHARVIQQIRDIIGGGKLAGLVNNAGIAVDMPWAPAPSDVSYGDMTDRVLQTNFLGPLKLTQALIEEGLLTDGSRILFISSGGGHIAMNKVFPDIKDLFLSPTLSTEAVAKAAGNFVADAQHGGKEELEQKWNYTHRYGFSKLCVSAASRALAREHPSLVVHACTPGFVKTRMTVGSPANLTPEEGASVVVHLLLSQDASILESGKFFNHELQVLTWDDDRYVK